MLRAHFAAHMLEAARPGFHVELGAVRGQVLRIHIQGHVAAGLGQERFRVVLHVVGMQLEIPVLDFHLAVGEKYVAFLALLLRFQPHVRRARLRIGSPVPRLRARRRPHAISTQSARAPE